MGRLTPVDDTAESTKGCRPLPHDSDGWGNLTGGEGLAVVDVFDAGLDDVAFGLSEVGGFRGRRKEERGMRIDLRQTIPSKVTSFLRPFGSKRPEVERLLPRSSFLFFHPFDIVVSTLAKGINDSNEGLWRV